MISLHKGTHVSVSVQISNIDGHHEINEMTDPHVCENVNNMYVHKTFVENEPDNLVTKNKPDVNEQTTDITDHHKYPGQLNGIAPQSYGSECTHKFTAAITLGCYSTSCPGTRDGSGVFPGPVPNLRVPELHLALNKCPNCKQEMGFTQSDVAFLKAWSQILRS